MVVRGHGRFARALAGAALLLGLVACGPDLGSSHPGVAQSEPYGTLTQAATVCASGGTLQGVDVSDWQGSINWSQVAASGRKFAFAKATQGNYFRGGTFAANWAGMKANGMIRGAYHWIDGTVGGAAQADYYLSVVGGFGPGDLPPTIDWECNSTACGNGGTVSNGQLAQVASDFIAEIKAKTGLPTIIYTSPGIWSGFGSPGQFGGDPLWVANWGPSCPDVPGPWSGWRFWQYADNGGVPGIGGKVDLDLFNGDLAALDQLANADRPPEGSLDVADCTQVAGWAFDPDTPSQAINADLYFGGPAGSGATGIRLVANGHRPDLCTAIGSCDHGFSMATPLSLMDGAAHPVYAYGIDSSGNGDNPLLPSAPKSFTCPPPALPADPAIKRHIPSPAILAAWAFDVFTDLAPVPQTVVAALPMGPDTPAAPDLVEPNDGTGTIWVLDGNERRHVRDPPSMTAWRFNGSEVATLPASQVYAHPQGPDWPETPFLIHDSSNGDIDLVDVAPPPSPDAGPPDAGPADAGPAHPDAGTVADAGPMGEDAGPKSDGGSVASIDGGPDARGIDHTHASGGCGCSQPGDGLPTIAFFLALALASRRRRTNSQT